jgi:hypothetical protein
VLALLSLSVCFAGGEFDGGGEDEILAVDEEEEIGFGSFILGAKKKLTTHHTQ